MYTENSHCHDQYMISNNNNNYYTCIILFLGRLLRYSLYGIWFEPTQLWALQLNPLISLHLHFLINFAVMDTI